MFSILHALATAFQVGQGPVTTVGGRDLPLADPVVTTAGHCGETPVSVTVEGRRGRISVAVGGQPRDVTEDIAPLDTEATGRSVAKTFIACRRSGGVVVSLLFADQRSNTLGWSLYSFSVKPDLTVIDFANLRPIEGELADYFD